MKNTTFGKVCLVVDDSKLGKLCPGLKTKNIFLTVCQVLRDISCVNPSRTPKAFKGKGSAVSQGVNSGLLVLAGAEA